MSHYDDQYEAEYVEQENKSRQQLIKSLMSGYYDQFFTVSDKCKLGYVMLPVADARRMLTMIRELYVFETLKK